MYSLSDAQPWYLTNSSTIFPTVIKSTPKNTKIQKYKNTKSPFDFGSKRLERLSNRNEWIFKRYTEVTLDL